MTSPVDINIITNWPQAAVAVVAVFGLLVWPGVAAWLNSKKSNEKQDDIKTTLTTNNGGSTVKDQLDRIEKSLVTVDARLTELEAANGRHRG